MARYLLYVVPISLVGLMMAVIPAGATLRSDAGAPSEAAVSAKSTDAPIILAQRGGRGGGGRGGGGARGGGGGMRAGGGRSYAGARGGAGGRAGAGGGYNRGAAGSRNWSGVSASNRSVNAGNFNRTNVNTANVNRNVNVSGGGYYGGGGGYGWGGVAAGVAAGAVVGAAATAVATPNYYPATAYPAGYCPYPDLSELRALLGGPERGRL